MPKMEPREKAPTCLVEGKLLLEHIVQIQDMLRQDRACTDEDSLSWWMAGSTPSMRMHRCIANLGPKKTNPRSHKVTIAVCSQLHVCAALEAFKTLCYQGIGRLKSSLCMMFFLQPLDTNFQGVFDCITEPGLASGCLESLRLSTGLRPETLATVWQVANPDLKKSPCLGEWRAFCHLVGHCQAMSQERNAAQSRALRKAGGLLQALLRVNNCLDKAPPSLPRLSF